MWRTGEAHLLQSGVAAKESRKRGSTSHRLSALSVEGNVKYLIQWSRPNFLDPSHDGFHDPFDSFPIFKSHSVPFHDLHPFSTLEAGFRLLANGFVDCLPCSHKHIPNRISPRFNNGANFDQSMFCSEEQGEHVQRGCSLPQSFQQGLAELWCQGCEFRSAPALSKQPNQCSTSSSFEVGILDVFT